MIAPGQRLPLDFMVKVPRDGRAVPVRFGELLRRRTVVSVYMRNNTPTCDTQVASLVKHAAGFSRLHCDVIAISRDTCGSHARYASTQAVTFVLVSDPDGNFARAADAMVEKSMYGRNYLGPARAAFVLERDGTVLAVVEPVDAARHAEQVLSVLKALPVS